jgi:hypothetical protein
VNQLTPGHAIVHNCEGEQWDGQDSVSRYHNDTAPCTADTNLQTLDTAHPAATYCMGSDPNDGTSNPLNGAVVPIRIRVTGDNGGQGHQQYYASTQIGSVGWAVVYLGECQNGSPGLEGSTTCGSDGGKGEARQGAYVRDDTPGNVLATVVSAPGLTKGYVKEGDCDQATYQAGAYDPDPETARTHCGRDNTAIGVNEIIL